MSATTDQLVPRAELLRMEDERDAALLEVERLTRLLAEVEAAHEATKAVVGRCVGKMEALEDKLGDARLDAEGHRRDVAALEFAATSLIDQREELLKERTALCDQLINERERVRGAIDRVRDLTARGSFIEDPGSTHFDTCYHHHVACLAHQVRRILAGAA